MVNFNNTISITTSILQFRGNPNIFTKVKARTEGQMNRQTERRVEIIFFGCVESVKKRKQHKENFGNYEYFFKGR